MWWVGTGQTCRTNWITHQTLPQLLQKSMTAREGLTLITHPHWATLGQQFPFPGHFTLNSCKHSRTPKSITPSSSKAFIKHRANTPISAISTWGRFPCSTGYFCDKVPSLSNFSQGQGQPKWPSYSTLTTSSTMERLLLINRQQYGRQDGVQEHQLPPCSHYSVPEPGINTFTAMDSQSKKETKAKGWWTPHTVNSKQLILVLWPNGISIPIPRSPAKTHKSFWCFWIWARAFLSSSSCSCLAICKSCCTRRLRWTFVAKWCSTGNKHRQEPSNQAAELHCVNKINQVGGRFQPRKEERSWQGNTKKSL